jgi:hypothetical protein
MKVHLVCVKKTNEVYTGDQPIDLNLRKAGNFKRELGNLWHQLHIAAAQNHAEQAHALDPATS